MSLQRSFARDWALGEERPPQSYGRLPFAATSTAGEFAIPILPGECTWIGVETPPPPGVIELRLCSEDARPPIRITTPPDYAIKGIPVDGGTRPVATGDVVRLTVAVEPGAHRCDIQLVAHAADRVIDVETLPPLDTRSGFAGWRLP